MANLDQVKAQIRFQLDQLAGRNKHHDFEEIARIIVRERICSNVLPATGPVSAGGDQGRDFETFSTHLRRDPDAKTAFLRLISDAPLAFACTIERKKGLAAKVKMDVSKISTEGEKVAGIHFFAADELPVAKRHELQKWARKEHDISLEIYDRLAIADFLSDRDLFWVAEKYLDIPNEIYPPALDVEGEHWYPRLLEAWRQKSEKYYNHSEFVELKRGVRAAYGDERFKPDLSFWLQQFEDLILHARSNKLRRRAQFELLWSQLMGFGSLSGLEGTLRSFTSDAIESKDTVDLENAVALHASSIRGCVEGELDLTHEELEENQTRLEQTIAAELFRPTIWRRGRSTFRRRGADHVMVQAIA